MSTPLFQLGVRTEVNKGRGQRTVGSLMSVFQRPQCSDPRDRIYGFLDISIWYDYLSILVPHYSLYAWELAVRVGKYVIAVDEHRPKRAPLQSYDVCEQVKGILSALHIGADNPDMLQTKSRKSVCYTGEMCDAPLTRRSSVEIKTPEGFGPG